MTIKLFIFPRLLNPNYFSYAWECLNLEIRANKNEIILLDYDETFGISEIASKSADGIRENWISQIQSEFREHITVEKIVNLPRMQVALNLETFLKLQPEAQRSLKSVAATQVFNCLHFAYFESLFTELTPYYKSYLDTKSICEIAIQKYNPDEIILFNGRWPDQVAITEIASKYNIPRNHIEAGQPLDSRWFYEKYHTFDLGMVDQYLQKSYENMRDKHEVEKFATTWANLQSSSVAENPYLKNQKKNESFIKPKTATCTIFTSSIDEFYSNLPFEDCGWGSQEEAIRKIQEKLNFQKYDVTIRLHPNLGNKSWIDVVNTYIALGKLDCRVVFPWESQSSYNLLENSNLVITWGSTIGLEAAFDGKKVAFFGPTIYRSLLGAKQLTPENLNLFQFNEIEPVDKENAINAIYMMRNWGREVSQANPFKVTKTGDMVLGSTTNSFSFRILFHIEEICKIFRSGLRSTPNRTHHYLLKVFGEKCSNKVMLFIVKLLSRTLRERVLLARNFL